MWKPLFKLSLCTTSLSAAISRCVIIPNKSSKDNVDYYWSKYNDEYKELRKNLHGILESIDKTYSDNLVAWNKARKLCQ